MAHNQRRVNIAGLALIGVGILALVTNIITKDPASLFFPALGLAFIGWGLTQQRQGPLSAGSLLTGLGVGVFLSQNSFAQADTNIQHGIVLMCIGLGILAIIPLTAVIRHEQQRWELIPGILLTLIGLGLYFPGAVRNTINDADKYWPVLLIALGAFFLFRSAQKKA